MANGQVTHKENVLKRLRIIEGHLKKIISMVEEDKYCIDILQQTAAVKSALKKTEELLLANHMNHCVVRAIRTNGEKQAIQELVEVFKKAS